MRFSALLARTQRQPPAGSETISHQLLVRAGMVQQVAAGIYSYLPMGWAVIRKIEEIIREEMNKCGGQEVMLPALQPFELWELTGRYSSFGETLFTVEDRKKRRLVLGPTHEEVVTDLVGHYLKSYRDLPLLVYQMQTKFRDEPRPRGGLLRVREFIMKDLYSFHCDEEGLEQIYQKMVSAYRNIYRRCGLSVIMVEADSGAIGGKASHEFMVTTDTGEDTVACCSDCGWAANLEKATAQKSRRGNTREIMSPRVEVNTPEVKTIEEVADFLTITRDQTLKSLLFISDGKPVMVVVRGDYEINEIKLKNTLNSANLHLASDIELREHGFISGSISPVGVENIEIIADDSVRLGFNFVTGANKSDVHLSNVNYPRDFNPGIIADVVNVREGDACPVCEGGLAMVKGIEVGHVFKLGTFLSDKLGAQFSDQNGILKPAIMGCYGIGIGRLMAAAVEQNHDDKGIIWPISIAPYQVYVCPLNMDRPELVERAENIYQELNKLGLETLLDDRDEPPGVKFNDADLLGIPLRVTIGPRTLAENKIEVKWRDGKEVVKLPVEESPSAIREMIYSRKPTL